MKWEDIPVDNGAGKECVLVIVFKCLWKYITAIYLVQISLGLISRRLKINQVLSKSCSREI